MSANTSIEWTDRTWNAVRGCSRVSDGCTECYAMKFAHRFSGPGKPYDGLTTIRKGKVDWTGVARFVPAELDKPLRWRKPQRIFVNSMSDLFHSSLSNEEIAAVFGVMAGSRHHTFQVLTKRPERAREWFSWVDGLTGGNWIVDGDTRTVRIKAMAEDAIRYRFDVSLRPDDPTCFKAIPWPLPNVWLGVSVENQKTADERIPLLIETPSAVRFISAEPLLGPLDLRRSVFNRAAAVRAAMYGSAALNSEQADATIGCPLDWVIVGSESGPGARPMQTAWARSIVDQCQAAGVAVFVKQIANDHDRKGGDPQFWPEGDWPRQFPEARP